MTAALTGCAAPLPWTSAGDAAALLRHAVADPATSWSLGSFGAVAEFLRDADEPADVTETAAAVAVRTPRGGLRVGFDPAVRPVAYETPVPGGWNHAVALCLPAEACAMGRRTVVTELGPDPGALAATDRASLLFDLGLGVLQADICVRTRDPETVALLRAGAGRSLMEPGNPLWPALARHSPARVFTGRFGRIEVSQPIPPPDGRSPEGPHTHVLPKLLAAKRTHAATAPIPAGWVPVMHLFPPHPMKDGMGRALPFDGGRHAAFQVILDTFGVPELVAIKRRIAERIAAGLPPDGEPGDRYGRMAARVALRQAALGSPLPPDWAKWAGRIDRTTAVEDEPRR